MDILDNHSIFNLPKVLCAKVMSTYTLILLKILNTYSDLKLTKLKGFHRVGQDLRSDLDQVIWMVIKQVWSLS